MNINDILNDYEEVKDDLKSQSMSIVRIKLMISLSNGPKKTKELKKLIKMQSSTILHGLNELEKQNLVLRDADNFYLSEIGKIMVLKLTDMIKTLVSSKKFQRLWLNHEINAIPHDLLMSLGDLSNSQLIESENIDVFKPHETYMQMLLQSKEIKGLSPIFYDDYTQLFKGLVFKDTKVNLILTDNILKKTVGSLNGANLEEFSKLISEDRLRIWKLKENTKVAFTVTDTFLSFSLFNKGGAFDTTKNLISENNDAITWGNKLFEHYRQQAEKFEL